MVLRVADRVRETSTTAGTGSIALAGAVAGCRTFAQAMLVNDTCWYCMEMGASWEVGIGTLTAGTTLARTTVLSNSLGSTAKINFGAGTKSVYITIPAAVFSDEPLPIGITAGDLDAVRRDYADARYRRLGQALDMPHGAAPAAPPAGTSRFYADADGVLRKLISTGEDDAVSGYRLADGAATAVATLDIAIPSGFREIEIYLHHLQPVTAGEILQMRLGASTAAYYSGATDYRYAHHNVDSAGADAAVVSTGASAVPVLPIGQLKAGSGASSRILLRAPEVLNYNHVLEVFGLCSNNTGGALNVMRGASRVMAAGSSTSRIGAARFFYGSGNIEAIRYEMYGRM